MYLLEYTRINDDLGMQNYRVGGVRNAIGGRGEKKTESDD